MSAGGGDRPDPSRAVDDFLTAAATAPSGLVVEGEPGIGKTTLWLASIEKARAQGFLVLAARAVEAESVLAYTSLADLLSGLYPVVYGDLPEPQRLALERVLLLADTSGPPTNPHAVAAGFLSVVERLAAQTPVLLAIDDLQWLDPSSIYVIASAARRVSGPVGVLGTVRSEPDGDPGFWLQLRPDEIHCVGVPPLTLGGLHAVLSEHLGRSFARPTMVRIHEISGGNPLYALELARAMGAGSDLPAQLPSTLGELVQSHIGGLADEVQEALLAAACLPAPTVELVAGAVDSSVDHMAGLLAVAEAQGIVEIISGRVRFAHPLLAAGVQADAAPARRRAMHRRLANLVDEPELRARHLALSATRGDPHTIAALDTGADMARTRGAPAAAAELLQLAMRLGGDTPERRIRSAQHHLRAGAPEEARKILETTIASLPQGLLRAEALSQLGFVRMFADSFFEAAGVLQQALAEAGDHLALRARILVMMTYAQHGAGDLAAAVTTAGEAVAAATEFGDPQLLSQALSMRVMLSLVHGDGFDERSLARALELEDPDADVPVALRPKELHAMALLFTGQPDKAHVEMSAILQRCLEHGEDGDWFFAAYYAAMADIWRGDLTAAGAIGEESLERATQLAGDVPMCAALTIRASIAAFVGRVDEARRDASAALEAAARCRSHTMQQWPMVTLGFLEVSLGNHKAAIAALEPLLAYLDAAPGAAEFMPAVFVPEAVEALISVGRLTDAEPLVDRLVQNGRRTDRPWTLAIGGRCRAMLLAARDETDKAYEAATQAVLDHQQVPMPFERARTQLLLGQLQRRLRQKASAAATFNDALATFEDLGTRLWADRARAELARTNVGPRDTAELTPSERRIAEMVASGMTNRDVAATLLVSRRTVETNLASVYRKLGIHSRAELGSRIEHSDR